jgi:hypothetical protein
VVKALVLEATAMAPAKPASEAVVAVWNSVLKEVKKAPVWPGAVRHGGSSADISGARAGDGGNGESRRTRR